MDILILSDSHGCYALAKKALELNPDVDAVIFLGDGARDMERLQSEGCHVPMYIVRGNCDLASFEPEETMEAFDGHLVFFCHGHHYGVKYTLEDYAQHVKSVGAEIGLFGHTHLPTLEQRAGVTLFNPGSIGAPRFGAPSYGLMKLKDDGTVEFEHRELTSL